MNYRFPLKSWIVNILRERQKDVNKGNTKMPFIIMSSAAKIVQGKSGANKKEILEQVGQILKNENINPKYKGCIITNNVDAKINYNIGKTIVGYDFDGKPIECESESGRKISPVIIESLDIKADGTAMTRKMAMVNLRCFSLHQLELVEQFFLQMGMHVLIEFGDNSYVNEIKNNNILATKSDYNQFIKDFLKYQIPTATEFAEYLDACRKSKGSYDRFAGILYDYNYKINADGTFSVMATYIQGNEINYQMPLTISTAYGTLVTKKEKPTYFEELMENVANDLPGMDLEILKKLDPNDWQNEFFNFNKTTDSTEDSTVSSTPYISLKFILEIILNNLTTKGGTNPDFKLNIPNTGNNKIFKIGSNNYEKIVPIKIHKFITPIDDAILFPNKLFPKYGTNDKGILVSNTKNLIDASINGKSMVVKDDVEFIHPAGNIKINLKDPFVIGNALNIFVDYNRVITAWYQSYSRNDFLLQILELINDRSFGIFKLGYGNIYEGSLATIIDFKLFSEIDLKPTERDPARVEYRFNPLNINSIVRDFDFTFNMDSNAAAIAIQNANAFVSEHRFAGTSKSTDLEYRDRIYGLSSYANHATVDGLYSINQIQYEKLLPPTGSLSLYKPNTDGSTPYDIDYTTSETEDLINFKLNPKDKKSIQTLVVTNPNFLYTELLQKQSQIDSTQVLTNISISFKLDGISGFNIGETFQIDGVPEMRNKVGEFRINNIQHTLDNQTGWITLIEADWVYKYKS